MIQRRCVVRIYVRSFVRSFDENKQQQKNPNNNARERGRTEFDETNEEIVGALQQRIAGHHNRRCLARLAFGRQLPCLRPEINAR